MLSDLNAFRILLDLIPEKVGSLFSYNSLREDVGVAYATVRDWVLLSEILYFGFFVRPYSKGLKRSLKACHYWTDSGQGLFELHFVRDKEKREVDFLITREKKPWMLVECKSNDTNPSPHLAHFSQALKPEFCFQLVDRIGFDREYRTQQIRILNYEDFFAGWL